MAPIARYALRLADDALISAQRLCEWSARAPTLEEDIALANVGLDYLGRARFLYLYAGELCGRTEDQLAFLRDAREYENALIFELPRGDFAFTMMRQYLVDEFESRFFADLCTSADERMSGVAEKAVKEIEYHLRRSKQWIKRLGLGTQESRRRGQVALDELWGYTNELFAGDALERSLMTSGVAVDRAALKSEWDSAVRQTLVDAGFTMPQGEWSVEGGRQGVHTEHLGHLLTEMQFMQRAYPGLEW